MSTQTGRTDSDGSGRPPGEWPGLDPARAGDPARCCAAGCANPPRITLGDRAFCRAHWPAFRAGWNPLPAGATDLDEVYGREEAAAYASAALVAAGGRPLSARNFTKLVYEVALPAVAPLPLGERTGGWGGDGWAAAGYAQRIAFTRRMLDAFVVARLAGARATVEPTAAERGDLLATPAALAALNAAWAARGVPFEMTRRQLAYYRKRGHVPAIQIGDIAVHAAADLARLVETIAARGGWSKGKRGRPRRSGG